MVLPARIVVSAAADVPKGALWFVLRRGHQWYMASPSLVLANHYYCAVPRWCRRDLMGPHASLSVPRLARLVLDTTPDKWRRGPGDPGPGAAIGCLATWEPHAERAP